MRRIVLKAVALFVPIALVIGCGSKEAAIPFLMYPQAENKAGFLDSLDPDKFKYRITGRELSA